MDLDTFLTTLYVLVDDWYKQASALEKPQMGGARPRMSDSELLTVAVAGQWRKGVPWSSERGVVRYMQTQGRGWFPQMVGRSDFNARVRRLWGGLIRLQQVVADALATPSDVYECVDCLPLPAYTLGQALRESHHWLNESTLGTGGNQQGWYWGDKWLVAVAPSGAITGWLVGTAQMNDRWLLEGLLTARAGQPQLVGPGPNPHESRRHRAQVPRAGHLGGWAAVGRATAAAYLADRGFNGERWRKHWQRQAQAEVVTIPPANAPLFQTWCRADALWHAHHRQNIETAFTLLDGVFEVKQLAAHSRWGQYTRLAAKAAAYNIGLFINRLLGRPSGALKTLLC